MNKNGSLSLGGYEKQRVFSYLSQRFMVIFPFDRVEKINYNQLYHNYR